MDGNWKLRFSHCMFPVKAEVCGIPTLNYPNVCTEQPCNPQSALCERHSEIAKAKGIPTGQRDFIHNYCGVRRNDEVNSSITLNEVSSVDQALNKLAERKRHNLTPSTVAKSQGTEKFLSKHKGLLTADHGVIDKENCNKDTGEKQKSLHKWSRGLMHFVRGSGFIDSWTPLFQSESPSQAFPLAVHYLYLRLQDIPSEEWSGFTLSYDNMCSVNKMLVAKQPLPLGKPFDTLWLDVNKVIDRLHLKNHKDPRCKELYSSDSLKDKIPNLNTPVAEQTFVWAARFKQILGAMPKRHFLFLP
ncbi:uncharacterized protein LOC144650252 [Oculina patagonica]